MRPNTIMSWGFVLTMFMFSQLLGAQPAVSYRPEMSALGFEEMGPLDHNYQISEQENESLPSGGRWRKGQHDGGEDNKQKADANR